MKHEHESNGVVPFSVNDALARSIAETSRSREPWATVTSGAIAMLLLGAFVGIIYFRPPSWLPFKRIPDALQIECSLLSSKFTVPDDGRMYILMLTDNPNVFPNGGMGIFTAEPKSTYTLSGPFRPIQKCEITNYGTEPLVDVELIPTVTFHSVLKTVGGNDKSGTVTSERNWPLMFNKIDAGRANRLAFFVSNDSDKGVELKLPPEAKVHLMGDNYARTIPLHQSLLTVLFQFPASSYMVH
jgi:hypothetical protein